MYSYITPKEDNMGKVENIIKDRNIPDFMHGVTNKASFIGRQNEIRKLLCEKEYGLIPKKPDHMSVEILDESVF